MLRVICGLVMALLFIPSSQGASFPDLSETERNLTEVPGYPQAPAVVLFETAEVNMMRYPTDISNTMTIHQRNKILTEEGVEDHSTIEIHHSRWTRLRRFEGRTVLPNGQEIALTEDDIFEETASRKNKRYTTKAAFPGVMVGAIIEYRYVLFWDSPLVARPWYFNNTIPTLRSEITYVRPDNLVVEHGGFSPEGFPLQFDTKQGPKDWRFKVWVENPPAIPDEPLSYPFSDMAAYFILVPKAAFVSGRKVPLLESWEHVSDLAVGQFYKPALRGGQSRQKAKDLASAAGGTQRTKAKAIYRFVRDGIRFDGIDSIIPKSDGGCDKTLKDGTGQSIDQVLLLQHMLDAVDIDSRVVWSRPRSDGGAKVQAVSLNWFTETMLEAVVDGEQVFLLPQDSRLPFGEIPPYLAGAQALIVDRKKPETIVLPEKPFAENLRVGAIDLEVGTDGAVSGTGTVEFHGYHAYRVTDPEASEEDRQDYWDGWIEDRFGGFDPDQVDVSHDFDSDTLTLRFVVNQRSSEVLGDEAEIFAGSPFRITDQPLLVEPEMRRTPLLLDFADDDHLKTTIRWPDGWLPDAFPQVVQQQTEAGILSVEVAVDEAERQVTINRRLAIKQRSFQGREAYRMLRDLLIAAETSDAEGVVFSQR